MFDLENRSKPILKWAGGKSQLLPTLIKHMPKGSRLVEPFVGGGAVSFALSPGVRSWINDINPELMSLYKVVEEYPYELMKALEVYRLQYSEKFYYELRQSVPQDFIEQAARTIFLNKAGFNGLYRVSSKGKFNVPFGKRLKCPELFVYNNLLAISARLANMTKSCQDFTQVIAACGHGDVIYCDPPYYPVGDKSFTQYAATKFGLEEHTQLRDCLESAVSRGASILISNSNTPTVRSLFKDFQIIEVTNSQSIGCDPKSRGSISELLIRKQPDPPF